MDDDVISTFILGTTDKTLVLHLGRKSLRTIKELFGIATSHASREDVVGAIFDRCKRKDGHDKKSDEGIDGQLNAKARRGQR